MSFIRTSCVVAKKEFWDCARNLWLFIGSVMFALLTVAVVFGTAAIGGTFVFRPLDSVLNSIVTLSVFFIPLMAILIAYDAFVGERESNTLLLLLTYPIQRTSLLVGKLIGQGLAFLVCLILGFILLPLLSAVHVLPYDLPQVCKLTFKLIFSGWLLGLIFILVSFAASLLTDRKAKALAVLLAVWVAAVFLYDLGLLVLTIAFQGQITNDFLNICMELNPASAFRLLNTDAAAASSSSKDWGSVYLLLWVVILFVFDCGIFKKQTV